MAGSAGYPSAVLSARLSSASPRLLAKPTEIQKVPGSSPRYKQHQGGSRRGLAERPRGHCPCRGQHGRDTAGHCPVLPGPAPAGERQHSPLGAGCGVSSGPGRDPRADTGHRHRARRGGPHAADRRGRDTLWKRNPRFPGPGWRGRRYLTAAFHFRGASAGRCRPRISRLERRGEPRSPPAPPRARRALDPPPEPFVRGTCRARCPPGPAAQGRLWGDKAPRGRGADLPRRALPARGGCHRRPRRRSGGGTGGPGQRHRGTAGPGRPSPSPRPAPGSRRAVRAARRRTARPRLQHG